jgi:carbamoyl-phosphate synthase large subunit
VSLRRQDIYDILRWRNDQIDVLRQKKPLTLEEQEKYFERVIFPSYTQEHPDLILLSILKDNSLIGYGGLVHMDWDTKRAEVSFLTSLQRSQSFHLYDKDFTAFLHILKKIAFSELNLRKLTTETYDIRPNVIQILAKNGFHEEGRLRNHNIIQEKPVDSILHGCLNDNFSISIDTTLPKNVVDSPINLLVTSISQKIPLLKVIRNDAAAILPGTRLYGCDADQNCLGQYFVDNFWHCPPDYQLTEAKVLDFCLENDIAYIFPTRDAELVFYADIADRLRVKGIAVMVSPRDALTLCLDKELFYNALAQKLSVPIIPTSAVLREDFGKRIVVKENSGSGSRGIGLDLSPDKARDYARSLNSPAFQPYIAGEEFSIDMFLSQKSLVSGVIVRSRDVVVNGESRVTTLCQNPQLEQICIAIATYLELKGHIVFQAIVDMKNNPHIIECNCRIGGASTLSMKAGLQTVKWFIEECTTGETPQAYRNPDNNRMRMIRIPYDTFHYR